MKTMQLKIARIGNSRGVRIPAAALHRYQIGSSVIMEERIEGILLRPTGPSMEKLSWEDTASEMAAAGESWSEWAAADGDGLESAPWEPVAVRGVAESKGRYAAGAKKGRSSK